MYVRMYMCMHVDETNHEKKLQQRRYLYAKQNTPGVKKYEANQKQSYRRPKCLISRKATSQNDIFLAMHFYNYD